MIRLRVPFQKTGGIKADRINLRAVDQDPYARPDPRASLKIAEAMGKAQAEGDSLGGVAEVRVTGCPAFSEEAAGVWDRNLIPVPCPSFLILGA